MVEAVAALPPARWLLAVSGGRDSMVLLDAFRVVDRRDVVAVATFDHGSGPAATRSAALVEDVAARHGFAHVSERLAPGGAPPTEASWRAARWRFLSGWATTLRASVVTAHTRDDQAETVMLRILRGAGARGLAGMGATAMATRGRPAIARPLLHVPRAAVVAYAELHRVAFVEDPSNRDRRYARNRVRLDLLPALERVSPGFTDWLLDLGARAAAWREATERLVASAIDAGDVSVEDGAVVLRIERFRGLDAACWRVLWPPIAARVGVAMDRRGTDRAAQWMAGDPASGSRIPLAAGAGLERTRHAVVLRRMTGTT